MMVDTEQRSGAGSSKANFLCPTCGSRLSGGLVIRAGVFSYSQENGFRIGGQLLPGAIGAEILGLGIGAAIVSHPHHYYYGDGYYAAPPPPPPVAYYAPPPPPPPTYAYETVQRCRVVNQWDGYYGRYVQTRHCW